MKWEPISHIDQYVANDRGLNVLVDSGFSKKTDFKTDLQCVGFCVLKSSIRIDPMIYTKIIGAPRYEINVFICNDKRGDQFEYIPTYELPVGGPYYFEINKTSNTAGIRLAEYAGYNAKQSNFEEAMGRFYSYKAEYSNYMVSDTDDVIILQTLLQIN